MTILFITINCTHPACVYGEQVSRSWDDLDEADRFPVVHHAGGALRGVWAPQAHYAVVSSRRCFGEMCLNIYIYILKVKTRRTFCLMFDCIAIKILQK